MNLLYIYDKMPQFAQHYIFRSKYRPVLGRGVHLLGWPTFSANVKIGDYTFINQNVFMKNVTFGKFCSVARGLSVGLNQHPYTSLSNYRMRSAPSPFGMTLPNYQESAEENDRNTVIGNDVWIGQDVEIKGGVTIGDGAVIGARSVVTKDVPPYAIVAGVQQRSSNIDLMRRKSNIFRVPDGGTCLWKS